MSDYKCIINECYCWLDMCGTPGDWWMFGIFTFAIIVVGIWGIKELSE